MALERRLATRALPQTVFEARTAAGSALEGEKRRLRGAVRGGFLKPPEDELGDAESASSENCKDQEHQLTSWPTGRPSHSSLTTEQPQISLQDSATSAKEEPGQLRADSLWWSAKGDTKRAHWATVWSEPPL